MIQNGMILDGVYQIVREIGRGGTGIIYLAEHLRLNKRVVVKKIKEHFVGQINGRAEVDILKRLHHSYLPQVYDFLVIGGSIYTVMEYIEGKDLQYYLDRKYSFPEETVKKWLLQLAEVLVYLHSQNPPILHSDIKPGNIMITGSGDVCLIDFNISLDGETSKDVQGVSPWYAAPEQYERAQNIIYRQEDHIVLDGRMDIYSLGATFYRMMTGYLPSPAEDQSLLLDAMDIAYSDGLKAILSRMLKPEPSRRYASAQKLKRALEDVCRMDPVYRRYGYLQLTVMFGWILCVIAGALCIYYGSWQNTVENWRQAYRSLYLASENQEESTVIAEGTDILNDFTYRSYLSKNEGKKAEVLNIVGESYFRQEKYADAAACYREAWEIEKAKSEYLENYIVALIRDGQYEEAAGAAQSGEGRETLSAETQSLISMELAWMSGKTENAQEELDAYIKNAERTGDHHLMVNAGLLLADIYMEEEEYQEAVTVLEEAMRLSEGKDTRRRLGEAAYLAAERCDHEVSRRAYLSRALECYEGLNQSKSPSYEDRLNLALIQRALNKYESSNLTLKEMYAEYPDEYVIPMWMCYNYLDMAKEKKDYGKYEKELKFRYQDCKHIYDMQGEKNESMEELEKIMNSLEG